MKNPMESIQREPDFKDSPGNKEERTADVKLEDISLFEKKDFYARLAVHPEADTEDVVKAYKRKSMQYHPDRTNGNEDLERNYGEIMKLINLAYETLSDIDKRKKYDADLSGKSNGNYQNASELSDQEIESKVRLFSSTCDDFLKSLGPDEGMNKILHMREEYKKAGVPGVNLDQMILPSMKKYYVNFAENRLAEGTASYVMSPDNLVPEIMHIISSFQDYTSSLDLRSQFGKLLKKETVLDYWKRYILSNKKSRGFGSLNAKSQVMRLSDSISKKELDDIERNILYT